MEFHQKPVRDDDGRQLALAGRRSGDNLRAMTGNRGSKTKESDMSRSILDEDHIHPAIRRSIADKHADIVGEVQAAVAENQVVVVGMAQNPFPRKARKTLDALGTPYKYLEYGSYLGQWRRRNALKMWTGWPTFPMVFVKGVLVGGASELQRLIDSGEFSRMIAD